MKANSLVRVRVWWPGREFESLPGRFFWAFPIEDRFTSIFIPLFVSLIHNRNRRIAITNKSYPPGEEVLVKSEDPVDRHLGLVGAVGVGVGAIVGGGILALAGAAFAATGPSAIIAFALNGLIAFFTALSFAEVSSKFPQSGGTYTFAKKVLSVEAAFVVGWVVWFASIVAAALYALGFAEFATIVLQEGSELITGGPPQWEVTRPLVCGLAVAATVAYSFTLIFRTGGGGSWANVGKVIVFGVLIGCGLWALRQRSPAEVQQSMQPFLAEGLPGLLQAMGFSFIALQGFDLIAAVAGEVRQPERTIPRAMLISLGIAIVIYLAVAVRHHNGRSGRRVDHGTEPPPRGNDRCRCLGELLGTVRILARHCGCNSVNAFRTSSQSVCRVACRRGDGARSHAAAKDWPD